MAKSFKDNVRAFRWVSGGKKRALLVLDQLKLPREETWIRCVSHARVAECIKDMNLRGAPAIGCAAAYGLALVPYEKKFRNLAEFVYYFGKAAKTLASTRPTAVNLFWAIERMDAALRKEAGKGHSFKVSHRHEGNSSQFFDTRLESEKIKNIAGALEREAVRINEEDLAANYRIGELGAKLLPADSIVLTHCNAGSLATSGWGTALGVIRSAYKKGKIKKVFVDETRPYLQGARLTAWELKKDGIPLELITDNMAAHIMKTEKVGVVIVGSDRIAENGDVCNKIGTYALAVLCKYHKIPFYAAAPTSTIDLNIRTGKDIPIEERSHAEVTHIKNHSIAPEGVSVRHPAFDVTPRELVTAIITEKGVARPPSIKSIRALFNGPVR